MSVYDMPARMSALLQNASGIANFGVFPVGPGIPEALSKMAVSNVGQSVASIMDPNAALRQTAIDPLVGTSIIGSAATAPGANAGLGSLSLGGGIPGLGAGIPGGGLGSSLGAGLPGGSLGLGGLPGIGAGVPGLGGLSPGLGSGLGAPPLGGGVPDLGAMLAQLMQAIMLISQQRA